MQKELMEHTTFCANNFSCFQVHKFNIYGLQWSVIIMALVYWPEGSHNEPWPSVSGHYGQYQGHSTTKH